MRDETASSEFMAEGGANERADGFRDVAASLMGKLSTSVEAMISDQKAAGAAIVSDVAQAAKHAADDLERSTPDAARVVRNAADGVERVARRLRDDDLAQIFDNLRHFGRAEPLAFLGGAVIGGFMIARSIRSGRLTAALQGMAARGTRTDGDR